MAEGEKPTVSECIEHYDNTVEIGMTSVKNLEKQLGLMREKIINTRLASGKIKSISDYANGMIENEEESQKKGSIEDIILHSLVNGDFNADNNGIYLNDIHGEKLQEILNGAKLNITMDNFIASYRHIEDARNTIGSITSSTSVDLANCIDDATSVEIKKFSN